MANERAITGDNCLLEIKIDATWYPIFCAKSMSLDWTQEAIEVTSVDSSNSREYVLGMGSGTASASGVTKIDNTEGQISYLYFLQESIRRSALDLRVYLESVDGTTKQVSFTGLITNLGLTGDVEQFSQSSIEFIISGTPDISDIVDPPEVGELAELYKTLATDALSVSDALLDDVEIFLVEREGLQYDETTGTPLGRQFVYSDASNSITFLNPGNAPGESIHILYKPN